MPVLVLAALALVSRGEADATLDPWADARPVAPVGAYWTGASGPALPAALQPAPSPGPHGTTPIPAPAREDRAGVDGPRQPAPAAPAQETDQQDTFRLEIRDRAARPITIALPPLSAAPGGQDSARLMHEVLWNDLNWSMVFEMVDPDVYPPAADGDGPPDFAAWRRTGADAVLTGRVRPSSGGEAFVAEFRLFDIRSGDQVNGKQYVQSLANLNPVQAQGATRRVAHQFSDEAVLHYTGVPGVALTEIAFVSSRTGPKEIWVMDYDGFNPRRVTNDGFLGLFPSFSPDGDRILYLTYQMHGNIPNEDIGLLRRGGGRVEVVVGSDGQDTSGTWSPDGAWIAFSSSRDGNPEIYLSRADGSDVRRLTYNSAIDTAPSFSPNGRQIAFVSYRAGGQHLYTMGIDGTNVTRLRVAGGQIDNPDWNPRSELADLIAYTASSGGGNLEIFVYSLTSGQSTPLTRGFGREEAPSWSPDGRQIVFERSQGGSTQIHAMGIDGSRLRPLTREGNNQSPSWGGRR